jgi:hypothetical protein
MSEFLMEHSKEVVGMLYTEWNWDDALEVSREEGREEGIEQMTIAFRALSEGKSVDQAVQLSGLSPDVVERLRN